MAVFKVAVHTEAVLCSVHNPIPTDRRCLTHSFGRWSDAYPRCGGATSCIDRGRRFAKCSVREQTKMELVYQYLTGPRFRQRLEGIIEKFGELKEDLDKERKFMNRVWAN